MEDIFLRRPGFKTFEEDSVFPKIEGLNRLNSLNFKKSVTPFSSENGTGKSTLLEATTANWGFNPEGGSINLNFSTKGTHLDLHNYLAVGKGVKRVTDGFLLRAESFYNVATYAENIDLNFSKCGDKSLHHQSHGEGFLDLVNHRSGGNDLYLLDEPEAAPSPQRQLALIISMKRLVDEGSQSTTVSHLPMSLTIPDSQTISLDKDSPLEIMYKESMPYEVTSLFLDNKNRTLSYLFAE